MRHTVTMASPLYAQCVCGWSWNASRTGAWIEWERVVRDHLNQYRDCKLHGVGVQRTKNGRCAICERERQAAIRRRRREAQAQPS